MYYDNDTYGCGDVGEFGEIYRQFYHRPKEAIKHLRKMQDGECPGALFRAEVGDIDIVWGEVTNPITHEGYGLAHIIDKHEDTINALGFDVESFIPIVIEFGGATMEPKRDRIVFNNKYFRFVVKTKWNGKKKTLLLTAFDLIKKPPYK